eukprot:SAG11_NODE_8562_length_1000_cov_1.538291_1_plen_117_part_01
MMAAATPGAQQAAGHACVHCGQAFASRNRMFRHLKIGADGGADCMRKASLLGAASAVRESQRVALLVGYEGERYAGAGAEYQGHGWQSDGIHGELDGLLCAAVHGVAAAGRGGGDGA